MGGRGLKDPVTDYAIKVLDGTLPAGPFVVWACQRHLDDLKRDDIYLDLVAAWRWIKFFGLLKHYKDHFAGKPIKLEPWQQFRVGSVFGWKRRDTELRRFRVSFNKVPRKNGKTTEMAGIGLGGLILDGITGAEVYSVATRRDQARIVFEDAQVMGAKSPAVKKRLKFFKTSTVYQSKFSKWLPLSKDSKTMDGLNPSLGLYDEFAMWRDYELRGKIREGMASRKQPLEWIVTTEGTMTESPCCSLTDHAACVLNPDLPDFFDDTLFAYLATPFEGDDPGDPKTWATANPNLGVSKFEDFLREGWATARQMPSEQNDFLTYQLNILCGAADSWLGMEAWANCAGSGIDANALAGQRCFAGLDLALVHDLSALVLVFPDVYPIPVLPFFWCPKDNIRERSKLDKVPYDRWARDGYITATPGNATDFNFIKEKIIEICGIYNVCELLYDRALAQPLIQGLIDEEINCIGYGQGYLSQNNSLREIERLVKCAGLQHGNHPILSWNVNNAQVIKDPSNNIKLFKKDPRKRIDGLAALSNAFGGVILSAGSNEKGSVYDTRGIISL